MRVPSSAGDLLTLASSVSVVVTPARQLVPQPQKLGATRQACRTATAAITTTENDSSW